jgi:hypothetical protein
MARVLTASGAAIVLMISAALPAAAQGAPVPGAVQEASATAQATGDGSTATATATCPAGTKAAGGGFDAPSSIDVIGLVYESVRVSQHAWRASVQLFDMGDPSTLTLTTYVYCRAHLPATKTSTETVSTTGELQIGPTASASCAGDETAIAGGFHMPPPLIAPTVTDLFFDSLRSGDSGWDARVVTGPAGPSTITSEAYCSRRDTPPEEVLSASDPVGLDSVASSATASCPAGLTPAAGGFAQPDSVPVSFFFVTSSRRVGDGWQVSGLHSGGGPAVALQAAAYCS